MMSDKVRISCTFGSAAIIDLEERYCYVQGYDQEFFVSKIQIVHGIELSHLEAIDVLKERLFCIKGLFFDDLLDVLSSNDRTVLCRSHPSLKSRKSEPSLFLPRSKAAKNSRLEPDTMALDQYMEETVAQNDYNTEDKPSLPNWKSVSETVKDSDDSPSSGFDCNICLDSVHDPVVTLCGHLYCWPCIYKWLHFQSISDENQDQHPQQQCPVCKAEVSQSTIVPLFGRGQTTKPCKGKAPNLGIIIPRRPPGRACGFDSPRSPIATSSPRVTPQIHHRHNYPHQSQRYYSQPGSNSTSPMRSSGGSALNMPGPEVGMFGEIMYSRVFGNSISNIHSYPNSYHLAGSASPRVRRHVMQADRQVPRRMFCSLNQIQLQTEMRIGWMSMNAKSSYLEQS
ncbi:hypothetical protein D5086_025018 [Populus alba]|uniref:Uncharacterized protein n=1 Tax=Populus alba TaxID=43335 RepID=A0ACC4B7U0_POPAL